MLNEIKGPIWPERCGHGGYIGSFECEIEGPDKVWFTEKLDLYVWKDGVSVWGTEICIRYGEDDSEYYSPGGIDTLISVREWEPYRSARAMLMKKGNFSWEPKK